MSELTVPFFASEYQLKIQTKERVKWEAKFQFEFIEWMEKYSDDKGHYPPPMQCYMFIMNKLK